MNYSEVISIKHVVSCFNVTRIYVYYLTDLTVYTMFN